MRAPGSPPGRAPGLDETQSSAPPPNSRLLSADGHVSALHIRARTCEPDRLVFGGCRALVREHAEHPLLAPRSRAGEEDLRGMHIALSDRALRVAGSRLDVDLRI